ncbi:B-cell receptor CD22 isoform X3 [Larimichthys crocea]|uniref:B-cell receptor CD22 isoform X3 n=1 Tax=Larimichthys crocea TaxID=215358 RepID=UPI000F5E5797|nr:B-cell receptor CD22 isoform X3 [Larimichthys crocea]
MSLTAPASVFVVFLLSVQVIQGQNSWGVTYTSTEICASKGSTVEMSCTYRYPSWLTVQKTFWFTKLKGTGPVDLTTDSEYSGRVQNICDNNKCTLRITDLRESDSAEYKFRIITNHPSGKHTGLPGVTLSVTDLQVRISSYQWARCHSSYLLPYDASYIWYKNGQTVQAQTSSYLQLNTYNYENSYSCAVNRCGDLVSPPVCVHGQNCNRVTYTDRSICAFKGSSVDISCTYNSYDGSITSKFWFSPERSDQWQSPSQPEDLSEDSLYAGRVQVLETERGRSTLRIRDLRESDSAQYHFKFKTTSFEWRSILPGTTLTVTALQVQVNTISVHQDYAEAELKCHSSCSPAGRLSYVWFKNGQKVREETSSYKDWFHPEDVISCALKGHENYGSPSVCVHGQNCNRVTYTDRSICASKGSSVDISCTYNSYDGSITSKFWFSSERSDQWQSPSQPEDLSEDSLYAGRVQVLETERGRSTLRIRDLRESDSAQYHFKFKTRSFEWRSILPGTTLTVTALQVQVNTISVHQDYTEAELKCHSSCSPAGRLSYVWFKNGQKVREETSSYKGRFYPEDVISCALKGHENYGSPSVCVYGQNCNRVTYTDRSICAFKGSSVDISCTYNSYGGPITSKFWFSPERSDQWQSPSQLSGRVQVLDTERGHSTLRISDLKASDSTQYRFKFKRTRFEWRSILPGTTLTVTDPDLQLQVIRSSTGPTLICHSSCLSDRSSFIWYKNKTEIMAETSPFYRGYINPADHYSCAYKNYHTASVYAPMAPLVQMSSPGDIMENSSVTLTCSSDAHPAAKYTWYKKNGGPDPQPVSKEAELVFRSIQSSDSGEYYCTAENDLKRRTSESISVHVKYGPKTSSVSVSPSGEIVEGGLVTLTCSSDANPAANYTWYKVNEDSPKASGQIFTTTGIYHFNSISSEDRGNYYCKSENQYGQIMSSSLSVDVQYAPKLPSVSVSPSAEIVENSSVTLTCSSDANPAANYTWYKKNGDPDPQPLSKEAELVFRSIQSSDSGEYYCTTGNRTFFSKYISLDVKYPPRLPSVSVSPSAEIVENSSVTLSCSSDANPAAKYTWYKEKQKVFQGPEGHYNFMSISPEDTGNYTCKSENQYGKNSSSVLFIDVQYPPKLPSVSVSPSAEILEGSSVTLTCSSDANPAAKYTWYKENEDSPKASGQIFTITDITPEHSGNYYCEAQNRRGRHNSTLHLTVVAVFPLAWTSAAIGTTLAVFLAVICLTVFLRIRKKKTAKQSAEPEERPDNAEQTVEQDDLNYASIRFSHNQTDPVYYNIRQAGPRRQREEEEEEEEVDYTDINFKSAGATPRTRGPDPGEDPATLYSTVNNRIECKRNF